MNEAGFRDYLEARRLQPENVELSVRCAVDFERFLDEHGSSLEKAEAALLQEHIRHLIEEGKNTEDALVAVARYCRFAKRNDLYIHIAGLVNAREVLPGMRRRLGELAGKEVALRVFAGFELPPLGAPQESYPMLTKTIILRMEDELPPERCKEILTWNYHEIPPEAFLGKKERFEKSADIDGFLEEEHLRLVEEISRSMRNNDVWYEQEITPEVVEFVKADQEISAGKRYGDWIIVTKIPFAPKKYLEEREPRLKRYFACHCPLARASILEDDSNIPPVFCNCSAGFDKLPFDVMFGEPVEIEMLESVLRGDLRCRFAIRIPEGKMKKENPIH
ncbi:MAG: hypothetical protein LUQ16_09725 [Methanomassiliicoccales archaeon]|nr:hypothetical protein [Methanomassiliicoccales archaeon]